MKQSEEYAVAVIGGDLRQMAMAKALAEDGCRVTVYAMDAYTGDPGNVSFAGSLEEAIRGADITVLPLPVSRDGERLCCPLTKETILLSGLFSALPENSLAAGGKITAEIRALAEKRNVRLVDYFAREDVAVSNAVPTAEGALALAMTEVPYTIRDSRCLVLGYGRIGKVLARTLAAVGAHVTVAARKPTDLAWIRTEGFSALPFSAITEETGNLSHDIVFNTVPAEILTASVIERFSKETLFLDLASAPGGIDLAYAKEHGYHVIWALSLPGKTAPVTAGRIIGESILEILREELGDPSLGRESGVRG